MRMRSYLFLFLLAGLVVSGLGFTPAAAETATPSWGMPVPPAKVSERLRYIPYDDVKEVLQKDPTWVIITRNQYETLKETKDAFLARKPASPQPVLDAEYVFGVAHYRGTVKGRTAEFEARIPFTLGDQAWTLLPLPAGDVGLLEVEIDGKPAGTVARSFSGIQDSEAPKGRVAILQQKVSDARRNRILRDQGARRVGQANDFFLVAGGAGSHELTLRFIVPLVDDPDKQELTFRIPRIPLSNFEIHLEGSDQVAEIDRAEGIVCRDEGKTTVVEGALGSTDRFTLRWAPRTVSTVPAMTPKPEPIETQPSPAEPPAASQAPVIPVPDEKPKVYADSYTLISIGDGYVRQEAQVRLNIARAARGTVSFLFPPGADVIDVRSPRLENTQITRIGSATRVLCRLNAKIQGTVEFSLIAETKIAENLESIVVPVHRVEDVERERGFVGVEPRTSIEIRKQTVENDPAAEESAVAISWIDVAELPAEITSRAVRPILLGFRYNQPPYEHPVQVQAKWHRDYALLNATVHRMNVSTLLETDGNSFTSMELQLKANGKQFLEVALPEGVDLESAGIDGAPTTPTMKSERIRLISLTGSQTARDPNQTRTVSLVVRNQLTALANVQQVPMTLPVIDIPISSVQWTLYGPDRFVFLPLPDKMMPLPHTVKLGFFDFCLSMAPWFLGVLVVGFFGIRLWRYLKAVHDAAATGDAPSWTLGGVLKLVVPMLILVFVILSVSGPMIGSISDQSPRMFNAIGTLEKRLDQSAPSPSIDVDARSMNETADYEEEKTREYAGKPGMLSLEDQGLMRSAPMKKDKSGPKAPVSFRVRSARDAGALPVEISIPTTANSVTMQRQMVAALESVAMRVIILWKPLEGVLTLILGLIGLAVFLLLALLALNDRFVSAYLVLAVFLLSSLILEQFWYLSQWPAQTTMFFGLCVLLIGRILVAMKRGSTLTVIVLAFTLSSLMPLPAAELDPRVEQTIDVYVPFQQLEERLPKDGNLVFLKLEEYNYLRDLGLPKPDPARWLPPVGVGYRLATFTGTVLDDRVEVRLRMEVELLGKGYKLIEFPCQGIGVRDVTLNGKKAWLKPIGPGNDLPSYASDQNVNLVNSREIQQNMQQMVAQVQQAQAMNQMNIVPQRGLLPLERAAIVTDETGLAVLEAVMVKDLNVRTDPNPKNSGFRLPLPAFSAARFDLLIPRPGLKVEMMPSAWLEAVDQGAKTQVRSVLQPARELVVEWRDGTIQPEPTAEPQSGGETASASEPVVEMPPKVFVDHEVLTGISDGAIVTSDLVRLNIEQSPISEVRLTCPQGIEIMSVDGRDVASWKTEAGADSQTVRVVFHAARQDRVDLTILGERAVQNMNGKYTLDLFRVQSVGERGGVERERWMLGVETQGNFAVELQQIPTESFVDVQQLPESIAARARGFMTHACKLLKLPESAVLEIAKHREVAVSTAQIDGLLATTRLTLDGKALTRLQIVVRNNNNQFLIINDMPASETRLLSVQVDGELVKAGYDPDGRIYIPLVRSPRADKGYRPFAVVIYLEDSVPMLRKPSELQLSLPRFSFDISQMNWVVMAPPEVFFMKAGGPFQSGGGPMPPIPGSFSVRSSDKMVQPQQNQVFMKGGAAAEGSGRASTFGGVSAGRLPVEPELPTTGNVRVFNKKLVLAKDQPPKLVLFSMQENLLRPFLAVFVLLVAFLVAASLNALWPGKYGEWSLKLLILVVMEGLLLITDWIMPTEAPILPRVQAAFWEGIVVGFSVWVLWRLLCGLESASSSDKPEATEEKGA